MNYTPLYRRTLFNSSCCWLIAADRYPRFTPSLLQVFSIKHVTFIGMNSQNGNTDINLTSLLSEFSVMKTEIKGLQEKIHKQDKTIEDLAVLCGSALVAVGTRIQHGAGICSPGPLATVDDQAQPQVSPQPAAQPRDAAQGTTVSSPSLPQPSCGNQNSDDASATASTPYENIPVHSTTSTAPQPQDGAEHISPNQESDTSDASDESSERSDEISNADSNDPANPWFMANFQKRPIKNADALSLMSFPELENHPNVTIRRKNRKPVPVVPTSPPQTSSPQQIRQPIPNVNHTQSQEAEDPAPVQRPRAAGAVSAALGLVPERPEVRAQQPMPAQQRQPARLDLAAPTPEPRADGLTQQRPPVTTATARADTMTHRSANSLLTGTARGSGIRTVARKARSANLFVSRLHIDVTEQMLADWLQTKLDLDVLVTAISTRFDYYRSFKVQAICSDPAVFLHESLWPDGALVRWWRPRRGDRQPSPAHQPSNAPQLHTGEPRTTAPAPPASGQSGVSQPHAARPPTGPPSPPAGDRTSDRPPQVGPA